MLKRVLLGLTDRCGVNALVRHATTRRHRLLTLCYHSVLPRAAIRPTHGYRNVVSVEDFREQLATLGRWFEFATPAAVLDATRGTPLPKPSVLITFDDGHDNLRRYAAPVLEELGVPAIFHVTTGHVGSDRPMWPQELTWLVDGWRGDRLPLPNGADLEVPRDVDARAAIHRRLSALCKGLPDDARRRYLDELRTADVTPPPRSDRDAFRFLDWDGVRDLRRRGFVIGSHTVDHAILSRASGAALDHELDASRRRIESEVDAPCEWIAYPNGSRDDVSARVFARSRAAGYRAGFTTLRGFDDPAREPLAIGRICVPGGLPARTFRAMTSGVQSWLAHIRERERSA